MPPRFMVSELVPFAAAAASFTTLGLVVHQAWTSGEGQLNPAIILICTFAVYGSAGIAASRSFRLIDKLELAAAFAAVTALLLQTIRGRLGILAIPTILVAPVLPLLAAAWLARRNIARELQFPNQDTPILDALLRSSRDQTVNTKWLRQGRHRIDY